MWRTVTAFALLGVLAACSAGEDLPAAMVNITSFHQKLNAQDFAGIYNGSGLEFKNATTEANWVQLASAVHRKLGNFQSGSMLNWKETANTSGHFFDVNYSATYDRGTAQENFTYKIDGKQLTFVGYHVASNALIVN